MKSFYLSAIGMYVILIVIAAQIAASPNSDGSPRDQATQSGLGLYASGDFVTKWNTSNPGISNYNQIKLPLEASGTYNFQVDWGDSSSDTITSYNQAEVTHTYIQPGVYTVTISGTIKGWRFNYIGDVLKLTEISQWGNFSFGNTGYSFAGAKNMVLTATDAPNLLGVTNLAGTFKDASTLGNLGDMSSWDMSGVQDTGYMFDGAEDFNLDISMWNMSSVTDMTSMFSGASAFNQPVGSWNISSVTDMSFIFYYASSFNQSLNSWDTSSVTTMQSAFQGASMFNSDISGWDTASVTDMREMFYFATSFNQPIGNWDVSSVTGMRRMFSSAISFNQPIGNWDVSSVSNIIHMFSSATSFNQPIGDWDVSGITSLSNMFWNASSFNQDLSSWDTSSVNTLYETFSFANSFNGNISGWDTTLVTSMYRTFTNTSNFDQDLSSWNVSSVQVMDYMFDNVELSTKNYNALLNSWSKQPLQSDVKFSAGKSIYSARAAAARQKIIDTYNWTITDGGFILETPDSPSNLTMTQQGYSINLYWEAPSYDGGSAITQYKVYRSNMSGSGYQLIGNSTTLNFTDSSITLGRTLYYVVTASNSIGEGTQSPEIEIVLPAIIPDAPLNPIISLVSVSGVTLMWEEPRDGGASITQYRIYRSTTSGAGYKFIGSTIERTFTDGDIVSGTTYYYVISAVNAIGESEMSIEVSATTPGTPPSTTSQSTTSSQSTSDTDTDAILNDSHLLVIISIVSDVIIIVPSILYFQAKRKNSRK